MGSSFVGSVYVPRRFVVRPLDFVGFAHVSVARNETAMDELLPGELPGGVLAFEIGVICADEMALLLPKPKEVTDRER